MLAAHAAARSSAPNHAQEARRRPRRELGQARVHARVHPARPRPRRFGSGYASRIHCHEEDRSSRRPQPHETPFPSVGERDHADERLPGRRPRDDRPVQRHRARLLAFARRAIKRARPAPFSMIARLFIWIARGWQLGPSQILPPSCRYQPSCSAYAITAIERYGAARGGWMALKRICRCHPWGGQGHDPVP
jgi:putative membrane protein insertion efficiency factor